MGSSSSEITMLYTVITATGFQMDDATGGVAQYATAQEAMKHMGPGDQIIPISDEATIIDMHTGKTRMPTLNRSGRGVTHSPHD